MTDQCVLMPVRYGTTAGSPEFEAVAKEFGIHLQTFIKTERKTLKGFSTGKNQIQGKVVRGKKNIEFHRTDAKDSLTHSNKWNEAQEDLQAEHERPLLGKDGALPQFGSFRNPRYHARRRHSSPGCLSCVLQDLSLKKNKRRTSTGIRSNQQLLTRGNDCSSSTEMNDGSKFKQVNSRSTQEKCTNNSLHERAWEGCTETCEDQEANCDVRAETLGHSKRPPTTPTFTKLLSHRNTMDYEDVPKRRNVTKRVASDIFSGTNGQTSWQSQRFSVKPEQKRITRRMSLPLPSNCMFDKSPAPSVPRRNSGPGKLNSNNCKVTRGEAGLSFGKYNKFSNLSDSLLGRRNSDSASQASALEFDSRKYIRNRRMSLPETLHNFSTNSTSSDDSGKLFFRKRHGEKRLSMNDFDDEHPHNLGKDVNPEHIFRLWNVKLPKETLKNLKSELSHE